jgi:hypothetical protein
MRRLLTGDRKNFRFVRNYDAWAIGVYEVRHNGKKGRFRVRRVVWGRLMARAEKQDKEVIRRAVILIRERM